jgi:hypothetical protein
MTRESHSDSLLLSPLPVRQVDVGGGLSADIVRERRAAEEQRRAAAAQRRVAEQEFTRRRAAEREAAREEDRRARLADKVRVCARVCVCCSFE